MLFSVTEEEANVEAPGNYLSLTKFVLQCHLPTVQKDSDTPVREDEETSL